MSTPDPAIDDEKPTLWVTDAELIRRSGVPEKIMRDALTMLDADPRSGFPKKQKLWGNRRYFPAVRAFWDRQNGVTVGDSTARSAAENRGHPHPAAVLPQMRTLSRRSI